MEYISGTWEEETEKRRQLMFHVCNGLQRGCLIFVAKSKIKQIRGRKCVAPGCSNKKQTVVVFLSFPKVDYYKKTCG